MTLWPEWESAQTTARWSDVLFWAGMLCLAVMAVAEVLGDTRLAAGALVLLGLTEIGAHTSAKRATVLTEREAARERAKAEQRHATEAAALRAQVDAAREAAEAVNRKQEPRRLTDEQIKTTIRRLAPFVGQCIRISTEASNNEAINLANQLHSVVTTAGWQSWSPIFALYTEAATGIQVIVHEATPATQEACEALKLALDECELLSKEDGFSGRPIQFDCIEVNVRAKP